MKLVVVLEGDGQISHRSRHVWFGHEGDVVAFHRLQEAFGHAVALRTAHRHGQRLQAYLGRECSRSMCDVARAVVGEPFDF